MQNGVKTDKIKCKSTLLQSILEHPHDTPQTLDTILSRFGTRSFGFALILLALPSSFPILPPGAGFIVGGVFVLIGIEMLIGLRTVWLPYKIRSYQPSARTISLLRRAGDKLLPKLERCLKPRLARFTETPWNRILGVLIIGIGIVIFSPIPFLNAVPAFVLLIIGLGLVRNDGGVVLVGSSLGAMLLLVVAFSFHSLLI
jgi:hypothetical protein